MEDVLAVVDLVEGAAFVVHEVGDADGALFVVEGVGVGDEGDGGLQFAVEFVLVIAYDCVPYQKEDAEYEGAEEGVHVDEVVSTEEGFFVLFL